MDFEMLQHAITLIGEVQSLVKRDPLGREALGRLAAIESILEKVIKSKDAMRINSCLPRCNFAGDCVGRTTDLVTGKTTAYERITKL